MLRRFSSRLREQDWVAVIIELTIVVAGVFLGIEAANWNEARRDRSEEKRYYQQIIVDLKRDIGSFELAKERSVANDRAAETILDALDHGLPRNVDPADFAKAVHFAGFLYLPTSGRRTYDELISTGNLRLLRDRKAKDAIAAYYEDFAELRQWDGLLRQQQADYWAESAGVVPRRVLQAVIDEAPLQMSRGEAEAILDRARANTRLKPMLIGMAAHQARARRDAVALDGEARALIKELQLLGS